MKSYKMSDGAGTWRVGFARNSVKQNELSSWVPVHRQFGPNNLAFTGLLVWEEKPPAPGLNIALIPYATGSTARDFEFRRPAEGRFNGGADVKIAVSPSLNLLRAPASAANWITTGASACSTCNRPKWKTSASRPPTTRWGWCSAKFLTALMWAPSL